MSHLVKTDIAVYKYGILRGWHLHAHNYIDGAATAIPTGTGRTSAIYINNPNADHYDVVLLTSSEPETLRLLWQAALLFEAPFLESSYPFLLPPLTSADSA